MEKYTMFMDWMRRRAGEVRRGRPAGPQTLGIPHSRPLWPHLGARQQHPQLLQALVDPCAPLLLHQGLPGLREASPLIWEVSSGCKPSSSLPFSTIWRKADLDCDDTQEKCVVYLLK